MTLVDVEVDIEVDVEVFRNFKVVYVYGGVGFGIMWLRTRVMGLYMVRSGASCYGSVQDLQRYDESGPGG